MSGARGLLAKWRDAERDAWGRQVLDGDDCAADLERELSLSDEEREAIELMNARRRGDTHRGWFLAHAETYDTIRALLARTFPAAGGDIGETK